MSIMSQRDMEALAADIEDGISMIVSKSHYYEIVDTKNKLHSQITCLCILLKYMAEEGNSCDNDYEDMPCTQFHKLAEEALKNRSKNND